MKKIVFGLLFLLTATTHAQVKKLRMTGRVTEATVFDSSALYISSFPKFKPDFVRTSDISITINGGNIEAAKNTRIAFIAAVDIELVNGDFSVAPRNHRRVHGLGPDTVRLRGSGKALHNPHTFYRGVVR